MNFPNALRVARRRAKLTQDQLASTVGVSRVAVTNWESGAHEPEARTLRKIAAALQVSVGDLMDAEPARPMAARGMRAAEPTAAPYGPDGDERYPPVVGTAQLGPDGFWLELEYPVGSGDGWIRYPSRDRNAYALRCKGDSMRPRIKPGEFVIVEPNHAYSPGDEVVVKGQDGRVMVKVFNFLRNGNIEVSSINEDHKPMTFDAREVELHYIAAICKPSMYYTAIA